MARHAVAPVSHGCDHDRLAAPDHVLLMDAETPGKPKPKHSGRLEPLVRMARRARYPNHAWPEDPWTAPAQRGPRRRSGV